MLHVAIIGSGPAGCYLADQLLRLIPASSIDVLERLPAPFGLIRYGVAPDHQGTKAIARVLDRVLSSERVNFFGNVEVGRDVGIDELMPLYDAVVLATGATKDRKLGIPGEDLPGVIGSGAFTGWYNSRPDHRAPEVQGVRSAVIIGNGNVAIDVARILAKCPAELAGSDLSPDVTAWLTTQPIETIHIVGRRSAADAKFTEHELAELGTLERARPVVVDPAALDGQTVVVEMLHKFVAQENRQAPVTINFHFNLTPVAFLGNKELRAVQFRRSDGHTVELPAQLAVTCIGYETVACCTINPSNGVFPNEGGKVKDRLYVVGWAKRGPSGTIPTNRTEAQQVAQRISQEVIGLERPGAALRELLERRHVHWLDYAAWQRLDAAELARAGQGRCREKFSTVAGMLEAAQARQNLTYHGAKG